MLTRLATDDGSGIEGDAPSYASHRDRLLGNSLFSALLVAAAVSLLQAIVDLSRYRGALDLRLVLYGLTVVIPLVAAALSRVPALRAFGKQIAIATDLSYTLTLVSFLADHGTTLSGIALNLALKLLTTAILFPWPPAAQHVSGVASVLLYWAAIWIFGRDAEYTHHLTAPLLAGLLASVGSAHVDRARRSLFQHAVDLKGSEKQLRDSLEVERHLVSLARQTAVLDDLPSVLSRLSQVIVEGLRCDFSTVFLLDEQHPNVLRLSSVHLAGAVPIAAPDLAVEDWSSSALARELGSNETIVLDDIEGQRIIQRDLLRQFGVRSIVVTPITASDRFLGVVMAGRCADDSAFDERQVFLLRGIAAHAAIAIRNAKLFQKLAASETAYRDLFERANDLIFIADEYGTIDFANKAALDFFAIAPEDLPATRWQDLLDDTERHRMLRRVEAALRRDTGATGGFEIATRTRQGAMASLELRTCRISPPGSAPRRYHCIARDVTERRRRHGETQALLERLQESNRLQDEFVANMSHELRTPLNVIIGYADLIADERSLAINSDARSFLDRINAASRALHRMVESILEYARLDRGRMVLIPTHFSSDHLLLELNGLCNDVRTSVDVELALRQEEPIEFVTDYDRLYSVLSNLLLNALKFTPRGRVVLHLRRNADEAEFVIRDTGIGIHPRELRHVFEPFRQADGSDTRTFGGVGLGLAIVRRNVDLLHGMIDVESEIDVGTTFVLRVPIHLSGKRAQHSEARGAA